MEKVKMMLNGVLTDSNGKPLKKKPKTAIRYRNELQRMFERRYKKIKRIREELVKAEEDLKPIIARIEKHSSKWFMYNKHTKDSF